MQDMSNIAIYLVRSLHWWDLLLACVSISLFLLIIAIKRGEKVQTIVDIKTDLKNMRQGSVVDLI